MAEHEDNINRIEEQINSLQQNAEDLKLQLEEERKAAKEEKKKHKKKKDDDDKFMFDEEGNSFLDKKVTVRQIVHAGIAIVFIIGLILLVKYVVGVTSALKMGDGNVTVVDEVKEVVENVKSEVVTDKEEKKAEVTTNVSEVTITNGTVSNETVVEVKNETVKKETAVIGGESGKFKIEFNGEGIETDESKGYGRLLKIRYKLINRLGETVEPDYMEYSVKEASYTSSPTKITLPSVMKSLTDNSEVAWTIDYKTDNEGNSLGTYAETTTKLSVTVTVRNKAGSSLATVTKEFSV
jgi:hypothetical protein